MTKIKVQKKETNVKKFSEIEIGDLFTDTDYPNEIYQKVIEVKDATFPNDEEILNAVLIAGDEAGNIVHFDDDETIILIDSISFVIN